jgi:hypothetical protein
VRFPAIPGIAIGAVVACGRIAFDPLEDPDEPVPRCPVGAGYVAYPELVHHYRAIGQVDYYVAKAICAADGTELATIDDAVEASKITELSTSGSAWAGVENADGEWRRQDGELATYLPWDVNEPSLDAPGAIVQIYPSNNRFRSDPNGAYLWFAYCECVP